MTKPTANWDKVGDRFYRRVQLYASVFDPDLELENYTIAGAPYSGAIAFHRDETKIQTFRGTQSAKSSIDIYTSAGTLIRRLNWDQGTIKGLGWSEDEKLIVVTEDGTVRIYEGLQSEFVPFSLGHGADEHGVLSCRFHNAGFVALLGNNNLISVPRYSEPRPQLLATPPDQTVTSWALIPPTDSLSRSVEVLLAIDQTILVVDATEAEDRGLDKGPFHHISVSPNGKYVALYTGDGKVWIISSDFQQRLGEYDSKVKTLAKDMQWCGNDAVALAWEDEVHLIGTSGQATSYYYEGWVHLLPDIDGLRLFTNDMCEFLQRVPDNTEEVFRLGSNSPAAVLLDAVDQLDHKSPKADDDIQLIKPSLDEAVDTCVRAAGQEYSVHWQKQLMKAASFGKSVLDLYNSDDFVDMCETLRVLNAVRFYEIGIPLSYEQYVRLTPEGLVRRLINRNEYLLALRVSDYLRLPADRIYVHWAVQKVRVSTDGEETICRSITQKLSGKKGISYEEIARAAHDEGRQRLATELLNFEPRAGKQVPLLLSMGEDIIALDKAIESGDTDLVTYVLMSLQKKLPQASFFRVINTRPVATALVESAAWSEDPKMLKDLYYQDDRRSDGAHLLISEALSGPKDLTHRADKAKSASKLLQDSKEFTFTKQQLDDIPRLLRLQEGFEKDFGPGLIGLSLNETIFRLIRLGSLKKAQKLQSEFKVTERTFWFLRLRALVAKRDWTELEDLSKVKKSPIGWEPFFNEILGAGNMRVAALFVPKCQVGDRERVDMWVKVGMVGRGAEDAYKARDLEMLRELRSKAGARELGEVERFIGMLEGGKR